MMLKLFLLLMISLVSLLVQVHVTKASIAKPGCQKRCGNLSIPYPFGIGTGCYLDKSFEVLCDGSSQDMSPLRFANNHRFHILDISMESIRVIRKSPMDACSSADGLTNEVLQLAEHFSYSHDRNDYVAVGCNFYACFLVSPWNLTSAGCESHCEARGLRDGPSTSCTGINGCCKTSIPFDVQSSNFLLYNTTFITSQCNYGLIAEKNHSISNTSEPNMLKYPMVLNWHIMHTTCDEARQTGNYLCGNNSRCINSNSGRGYKCQCPEGYEGNPYLASGCQVDVNWCEQQSNSPCPKGDRCLNKSGSSVCTRAHGNTKFIVSAIFASFMTGLLAVCLLGFWAYWELNRKKRNKIKQKLFRRNGGFLLKHQISANKSNAVKIKLYAANEIEKATGNFSQSRFLGKGGQGTVYKGMLQDGSIVAIKKANIVDEDQVVRFVNEVFILAQINHRNIVKLLGCCLEYEVPLLVYEYVSNGNLSQHLHNESQDSTFSWKDRIRIAGEVAGALAYLHSYASPAIFHRDIKPGNILLDENYRAVVSDFGLSRSVPLSRTHLTTVIEGTFGYLDPEYFRSGQLTEKSDVYAFGVVLTELLTRRKAVSSRNFDEGLVPRFQYSMKNNCLFEILDNVVVIEAHMDDYLMVATLAKRCLKTNPKKRPSMKEIVAELDKLRVVREELTDTCCLAHR